MRRGREFLDKTKLCVKKTQSFILNKTAVLVWSAIVASAAVNLVNHNCFEDIVSIAVGVINTITINAPYLAMCSTVMSHASIVTADCIVAHCAI